MGEVKEKKKNTMIIIAVSVLSLLIAIFAVAMIVDADFSARTKRDAERVYYAIDIFCLKNKDYGKISDQGLIVSDLDVLEKGLSFELQFDVEVVVNNPPKTIDSNVVCFKGSYNKNGYYAFTDFTYFNGTYVWKSYQMKINPSDFSSYIS